MDNKYIRLRNIRKNLEIASVHLLSVVDNTEDEELSKAYDTITNAYATVESAIENAEYKANEEFWSNLCEAIRPIRIKDNKRV